MTLIMAMSKPEGIYLSSDYRVTKGQLIDNDLAVKFLMATYPPHPTGPTALFGYTGIAYVPDGTRKGTPTAQWMRETLRGESDSFDVSMAQLAERLNRDVAGARFPTQISILVVHGDKRYSGGFTNMDGIVGRYTIRSDFRYVMKERTESFWYADGSGQEFVSKEDRMLLQRQLPVQPRSPEDHMGLLAAVNRRAAVQENIKKMSKGQVSTVSPFCHVAFVHAGATPAPMARDYTEPGEAPIPVSMPVLIFGLEVHDLTRDFIHKAQALRRGESVDEGPDADEINRSLNRRP